MLPELKEKNPKRAQWALRRLLPAAIPGHNRSAMSRPGTCQILLLELSHPSPVVTFYTACWMGWKLTSRSHRDQPKDISLGLKDPGGAACFPISVRQESSHRGTTTVFLLWDHPLLSSCDYVHIKNLCAESLCMTRAKEGQHVERRGNNTDGVAASL